MIGRIVDGIILGLMGIGVAGPFLLFAKLIFF